MTRGKKLLILLIVLLLVAALAAVVVIINKNKEEEESDISESVQIFSTTVEDVSEISWTNSDNGEFNFKKNGDTWVLNEDDEFPTDSDKVDTIAGYLTSVDATKTITTPEDLSEYGLDNPSISVTISDGQEKSISFGNTSGISGELYCSVGDGNVYLVSSSFSEYFDTSLTDLILIEEVPSMENVESILIQNSERDIKIIYDDDNPKSYSSEYVWYADKDNSEVALDTETTESLIDSIKNLSWNECVDYLGDLSSYGLHEPDTVVTVEYVDENSEKQTFGLKLKKSEDGLFYGCFEGSQMVYTLDEDLYNTLMDLSVDNLLPDEVLSVDWDDINAVDVTLDSQTYSFTQVTREVEDDDSSEDSSVTYERVWTTDSGEVLFGDVITAIKDLKNTEYGYAGNYETDRISFVFHFYDEEQKDVTLLVANSSTEGDNYVAIVNSSIKMLVAKEDIDSIIVKIADLLL